MFDPPKLKLTKISLISQFLTVTVFNLVPNKRNQRLTLVYNLKSKIHI